MSLRPCQSIRPPQPGFSLIELILAILIVTIGATFTIGSFMVPARSIPVDTEVQTATMTAQACAEHLLNLRAIQANGWDTVPVAGNTLCNNIPPTGYSLNLSIINNDSTPPSGPCDAAFLASNSCKEVTIQVVKTTSPTVPQVTFTFALVNY
jgi:prepilin-type N-terminal cleavage/methylation domain-containing protein